MEFLEYLKQREQEAGFIKTLGEKTWLENKVYFVDEILAMVEGWQAAKKYDIVPGDIDLFIGGFKCRKITAMTEDQLKYLESKLSAGVYKILRANVLKYKYLTVWYDRGKLKTSVEETNIICDILNSII